MVVDANANFLALFQLLLVEPYLGAANSQVTETYDVRVTLALSLKRN